MSHRALLLIDLQREFLVGLWQPSAEQVVEGAATLLRQFRASGERVVHIHTVVHRDPDDRMPHWVARGLWRCERAEVPEPVQPQAGETVLEKQVFSPFVHGPLESLLRSHGIQEVVLAGVHLHACLRATALDAYQRGFRVTIAEEACGSDDPLHAAVTRRYLSERGISFALSGGGEVHLSPHTGKPLFSYQTGSFTTEGCRAPTRESVARFVELLRGEQETLVQLLVRDVGKPVARARGELAFGLRLADCSLQQALPADGGSARRRPLGPIGLITPFNNPVAISLGKMLPALLFGNAVLWKPAPAAQRISRRMVSLARRAGISARSLQLVLGGPEAADRLARDPGLGGLTLSGGARAGWALGERALTSFLPYQAELGGNNAAIVWEADDLPGVARDVCEGAFGFAGQRCTANRRLIVAERQLDRMVAELEKAGRAMVWGDPHDPSTSVGPVLTAAARARAEAVVERARCHGATLLRPLGQDRPFGGFYFPPTVVVGSRPDWEVAQQETFAPLLVVQTVSSFAEALKVNNGVRQALVASLFTRSERRWEQFLEGALAGVLKRNVSTANVNPDLPFGGWKASGFGPPEHGPGDAEFFSRWQAVYR